MERGASPPRGAADRSDRVCAMVDASAQVRAVLERTWDAAVATAPHAAGAVAIVITGVLLGWLLVTVARRGLAAGGVRADVRGFLGRVVWFFVLFLTAAAALNALGLGEVALALGGAAAFLALAVGTAVGTLVMDFVSGAFLLSDRDFEPGMRVTTGEVTGELVAVDIRKSRIRDDEGKLHVVPNHSVDEEAWVVEARGAAAERAAEAEEEAQTRVDAPRWTGERAGSAAGAAAAAGAPPAQGAVEESEEA